MELERIITDGEKEQAFSFLKKNIYRKLIVSQEGGLKSHLYGENNPTGSFKESNKELRHFVPIGIME